jgi:PPM family protein phosphatase
MPDPRTLYVVMTIVVLGLVSWVIAVLLRPAREPKLAGAPASPPVAKRESPALPKLHQDEDTGSNSSLGLHVSVDDEDDAPTGPFPLILVTAVARTDPGLKRAHNEDAYAILEDHHLFVIADGMGRHAAGEVASHLCVDAIAESFRTANFGPVHSPPLPRRAARLLGAIWVANDRIYREAQANEAYAGMGTTVVCAYFSPNNQFVCIAHVGDSRCYRLRAGKLTQLTRDHTLGNAGIQGKTSDLLSRAVGIDTKVEVEVSVESPPPGDTYPLFSDGLTRMVEAPEIQSTLESVSDLDDATRKLVQRANERGGRDNITTILVRVDALKKSGSVAARRATTS